MYKPILNNFKKAVRKLDPKDRAGLKSKMTLYLETMNNNFEMDIEVLKEDLEYII